MVMKEKISRVKLFVKDTVKAHEVEKMVYKELIKNNFENCYSCSN